MFFNFPPNIVCSANVVVKTETVSLLVLQSKCLYPHQIQEWGPFGTTTYTIWPVHYE